MLCPVVHQVVSSYVLLPLARVPLHAQEGADGSKDWCNCTGQTWNTISCLDSPAELVMLKKLPVNVELLTCGSHRLLDMNVWLLLDTLGGWV